MSKSEREQDGERLGRFKPYPAYQDSEVEWLGRVPAHWDIKRLRSTITSCLNGVWGDEPDGIHDIICIRAADFDRVGFGVNANAQVLRSLESNVVAARGLRLGDLLLEKSGGGETQPVGAVVRFDMAAAAVCSNFVARITLAEGHDSRYLTYLHAALYGMRVNTRYIKQSTGIQNLESAAYLRESAGLPPEPEQRAIATFLDRDTARIDALVARKERLIELLQEKRTAFIARAVTKGIDPRVPMRDSGVEWLGEVPVHWEVAPVYARFEVVLGKMLDAKRESGSFKAPYLRNVNVQWDSIDTENLDEMDFAPWEEERYGLQPGDLLVCEGGEVGRTAIWHGQMHKCFYQKALHRVRPRSKRDVPRFFYYVMRTVASMGVFSGVGNQNTIDHLTAVQLKHYRFAFPPTNEQTEIVDRLDRECQHFDALAQAVRGAIDKLKELRAALISAAVTGKIDVREEIA